MIPSLSNDELERLNSCALQVLEKFGVKYVSSATGDILRTAGATIDETRKCAMIPSHIVKGALKSARMSFTLRARSEKYNIHPQAGRIYARPTTGFSRVTDLDSGICRAGQSKDTADISKLVQDLNNISINSTHVLPSDVPQDFTDVYSFMIAMENCEKHVVASPLSARNLGLMSQVASVYEKEVSSEGSLFSAMVCSISPLIMRDEVLVSCARRGIPVIINSSPTIGVSSPVSLSGTALLQNAENLAAITLIQTVNPGVPVIIGNKAITMDMRYATPTNAAIELALISSVGVQLARFYGLPAEGYGTRTDSKTLDEQAGAERVLVGLPPVLAGAVISSGAGSVEFMDTFSIEQLVIDDEIYGMVSRLIRGIDFDDERLAIEEIGGVDPGGNFLSSKHTQKFYLGEFYQRKLFDKRSRKDWEGSGGIDVRQAAREKAKEMLAEHNPVPELSPSGKTQVLRIIAETREQTQLPNHKSQ